MSFEKYRRLPFATNKDLPDRFVFCPNGWAEGKFGPFLKGKFWDDKLNSLKKDWQHGVCLSLTDASVNWLIEKSPNDLRNFDDLVSGWVLEFQRGEDGYLHVVDALTTDDYYIGITHIEGKVKKK